MTVPADICNQALDAIGSEVSIGDLEEGSREAQVLLRAYAQALRQLLRTANWDFARKQVQPFLLGDATGNTTGVATTVQYPWTYCYAYPDDCVRARFIFQNNLASGTTPLMTGLSSFNTSAPVSPAKFVVATDYNFTQMSNTQLVYNAFLPFSQSFNASFYSAFLAFMNGQGALPGSNAPNAYQETPGVAPTCRTVINTNVANAQLVYTAFCPYPNIWDALFREAFVAYLASNVCMAVLKDKKFALQMRAQQIALARQKIIKARIADGNEGNYSTNHTPDWMQMRSAGAVFNAFSGNGYDACGSSYDPVTFSDGSSF